MSDTKENAGMGWTSQDAGAPGWNPKATEQIAEYEQASRDRIAGIRAGRAHREANAARVTFVEERDVTDPAAHSQATGGRVIDPEQARDEHADGGQAQAGNLRAAELEGEQVDLQGASIAQQVAELNPAEQAALAQIMSTIDQQQEHGHDLER
ncbi:hypothetical protein R69746_07721 [Paraburkholderia aspalathi]|uniref:hypothetical protein n=1 Tax=Paraburkholderia aspalathi TaxID=1324617 RepID=UPI00190CC161|nr:hypothetical protein [Paraburkholderia aspalathi]MBK3843718.1 hypothetical protein [Paraburkholderia aspalathi]CAE6859066.1 hypothetical protein R69746_07721 [Paraburkholderia aspalathi]